MRPTTLVVTCVLAAVLVAVSSSTGSVIDIGQTQQQAFVFRRRPVHQLTEVPWLSALQAPGVMSELTALAADEEDRVQPGTGGVFRPNWDPTHILSVRNKEGWEALALMNKGQLLETGCARAPMTCAALKAMRHHLIPRPPASEVGVRILKLLPGAVLRPHHGPGGRIVAHLGIRVPDGATLTLAGQVLTWEEGKFTIFDDSYLHSAQNMGLHARYVLQVAFPHPDFVETKQMAVDHRIPVAVAVKTDGQGALMTQIAQHARPLKHDVDSAVIFSVEAAGVRLIIFANCSATAINTATNTSSPPGPLLLLFNRVADNRPQDWDVCVSATALDKQTLRVVANHSYGSVDVRVIAGPRWLTFELLSLERWHADPKQKHLKFNNLCPQDLCGVVPSGDPSYPWPGGDPGGTFPYKHPAAPDTPPGSRREAGTFIGTFGGAPVRYAAGFLTITSNWQYGADMWFAKSGWRLVYLIAPEAEVPELIDEVNAAEGIPKRSANRAFSWLWEQGLTTSANLNDTIKLANALGVQVILFADLSGPGMNGYLTNVGDYQPNYKAWPRGLGEIHERLAPHGLKPGFHMLSSGSSVCMDQMQGPPVAGAADGPWPNFPHRVDGSMIMANGSCRGDIMMDTMVSRERPELFVPQGLSPLHWHYAITAGTWPCHEKRGDGCGDCSRRPSSAPHGTTPLTPAERARSCEVRTPACPPSNPILLMNTSSGTASWSKLGRFRDGGAIAFSGGGSHGRLKHTPEYDFRNNSYFFNITSEFTLQMTIHPVGQTVSGRVQVLASKSGEWALQISTAGRLQWRVNLASGWKQAEGTRVLRNGSSYVVKATHAGSLDTCRGTLKLFSCELAADSYACPLSTPEGSASGLLPLQVGKADIILGGAERKAGEAVAPATSFVGAMEELFLSRISLENITAALFLGNGYPMYLFDYTQTSTRKYWADAVATIYNKASPVCGQWDGSEYQSGVAGWGLPHSTLTYSAGADALWWMAFAAAAEESKQQWYEDVAVEFSITLYGDG
eukprot:SAG11_NODE_939_length_6468_cov_4.629926_4_plen_1017_part_00